MDAFAPGCTATGDWQIENKVRFEYGKYIQKHTEKTEKKAAYGGAQPPGKKCSRVQSGRINIRRKLKSCYQKKEGGA